MNMLSETRGQRSDVRGQEEVTPHLSLRMSVASEAISNGIMRNSPVTVIPAEAGIQFFVLPEFRIKSGMTEKKSPPAAHEDCRGRSAPSQ
jgi:hypothetical protein